MGEMQAQAQQTYSPIWAYWGTNIVGLEHNIGSVTWNCMDTPSKPDLLSLHTLHLNKGVYQEPVESVVLILEV